MNKIYAVKWYNLDGYGILKHTTVIVQSCSRVEAEKIAKDQIFKILKENAETHLSTYSFKSVQDITEASVISFTIDAY